MEYAYLEKVPHTNGIMVDRRKISYISEFTPRKGKNKPVYTFWQEVLVFFGGNPKPKMVETYGYWPQAYVSIDGVLYDIREKNDEIALEIYKWFGGKYDGN